MAPQRRGVIGLHNPRGAQSMLLKHDYATESNLLLI